MHKALLLGSGLVSPPLVRYLLDHGDVALTVASLEPGRAATLIGDHARGSAVPLDADDEAALGALIKDHDVAISLLPAPLHPRVANLCIQHRRHMVTTSYVSPAMHALDGAAQDAGVLLLNEVGVDPGIDHMSAMQVIDRVRTAGGRVVSFRSTCGGLPAPDANDNPWGYKFSWSPRAVCTAGKNAARWREDGQVVQVPGAELFDHCEPLAVPEIGMLEAYPNRDALGYIDLYGLADIATMFRGTLRYPGWCATLKKVADLGLLDETPVTYAPGTRWADWLARHADVETTDDLRKRIADRLNVSPNADVLDRFEWLGLFSTDPLPIVDAETTDLDILAARMAETMAYRPGERDMIVLMHQFVVEYADRHRENITSTLISYGERSGDSAMARTVGLPAAIAARLVLEQKIDAVGVQIPVAARIYAPILDELAAQGIAIGEDGAG